MSKLVLIEHPTQARIILTVVSGMERSGFPETQTKWRVSGNPLRAMNETTVN